MTNERLRAAIVGAGLTTQAVSERIGVDPKTVERWISQARVPHRTHRIAVAALLGQDDGFLWPTAVSDVQSRSASRDEFVGLHLTRGSLPMGMITGLIAQSTEAIDLLAFAGTFLHDAIPDFDASLIQRARAGVRIRICLGDPKSQAVSLRGEEEDIGASLADRCTLTWKYFRPLLLEPNVSGRMHGSTLYNSIYRFDSDLLANTHSLGAPAGSSPVLQFHRLPGGRLFDHYMEGFERTWERARPITAKDLT